MGEEGGGEGKEVVNGISEGKLLHRIQKAEFDGKRTLTLSKRICWKFNLASVAKRHLL